MSEQQGTKNIVGEKLKKLREAKGASQKKIVDLLNAMGHKMTASTISKIETGNRGVSDIELRSFALIFGCSVSEFFQ